MPRLALAGNNLAAVYTLDLLLEALSADDVLVIAPQPGDRPDWQPSLAAHAAERGVDCLTPENVNEGPVVERIAAHAPDLFLSVYYTQIFRDDLMSVIGGKALNFHPSLLPRHRGNAPLIWSIVEGDRVTGLSVHHIDAGIDTGNIVVQRPLPIHETDTGYTLHMKMAKLVRATAGDVIRNAVAGREVVAGRPQTGPASYHSARDPRVNHLDWSDTRERIRNIVRALAPPLPGAFSMAGSVRLVLANVAVADLPGGALPKPAGMVELGPSDMPVVWAGDGPVALTTVVVDGVPSPGSALFESGVLYEGLVLD